MNRNISIDDLKCGMIIEQPIKNQYGNVIIDRGTIIEEKHFRVLKIWGIKNLIVKEPDTNNSLKNEEDVELKNLLGKKIKWIPTNEFEEELISLTMETIKKSSIHEY